MNENHFDVLIVGAGGVGSAAAWQAARRGARVLAIDRFIPPHDRGSSHGQTRIVRQAYFEHPDYVPLAREAYAGWAELERIVGRTLQCHCGLVQIGPSDGRVLQGVIAAARQHHLSIEQLERDEIQSRWPPLSVPEGLSGVYEERAGYLLVEECVAAQIAAARAAGARFVFDTPVLGWDGKGTGPLSVQTSNGEFHADRVIVAAGGWAPHLLEPLGVEFRLLRQAVYWYACDDASMASADGFPAYLFELPSGIFYGFPMLDDHRVKVAEHTGGAPIDDPSQMKCDDAPADRERVEQFTRSCLPSVSRRRTGRSPCMYTMSPDGHFIVDCWPGDERIVVAAGLSGHGFKFAPVLGKALVDLALDGRTELPIEFLSWSRLQQ